MKSDGNQRTFPLNKKRSVLGRINTCDLRIPLPSVSRQHCELVVEGETLKVRDMGSSNGTHHNGNRVQEATLSPGDEIVVGPVTFKVVIDGAPTDVTESPGGGAAEPEPAGVDEGPAESDEGGIEEPASEGGEIEMPDDVAEETASPTLDLDDEAADDLASLGEASSGDGQADDEDEISLLFEEDEDENTNKGG